ncbi:MAG: carbohydrate kinase [Acutalibacteraceae bacterium]|nr:carbohydrate kinase [Acutalibacteraceae bacterium]
MKALSFGEVLWDIYPERKTIGGAPFNFAAHLAGLGDDSYLISSVGDDELGKETLNEVASFGIKTDLISVIKKRKTGQCLVTLDDNSVPEYNLLTDVAYDYISADFTSLSADVLYFGTLSLRSDNNLESLCKILNNGKFNDIFVDINIRSPFYSSETVSFALENATIVKISDEELPVVSELIGIQFSDFKSFSAELSKRCNKIKYIIITLGSKGSYAYSAVDKAEYYSDAVKTDVLSTVGAGDSFSAAFIHKLYKGEDIQNCLDFASKIAAFVVSKYDAVPKYDLSKI